LKVLIIGFGSIGSRHARILGGLGHRVIIVSRRPVPQPSVYSSLEKALVEESPGLVVVANETSRHFPSLVELARLNYSETVLVEKPLFQNSAELPRNRFRSLWVAYNLRFHPVLQELKRCLRGETILSVQAYAGQYLPDWRPDTDYRNSYSAFSEMGGGVLRDLSHELDYLTWLFGKWERVTALGGHFSQLEIDSDDVFSILFATELCPAVSVQLNYLDRVPRRFVLINTARHSIQVDLINGTISLDKETRTFAVDRDHTYLNMYQDLFSDRPGSLCSAQEGQDVLGLIGAVESAMKRKEWVVQ